MNVHRWLCLLSASVDHLRSCNASVEEYRGCLSKMSLAALFSLLHDYVLFCDLDEQAQVRTALQNSPELNSIAHMSVFDGLVRFSKL